MKYLWATTGTIGNAGVGFSHFGPLHLAWLVFAVVFTALCCVLYRRLDGRRRRRMRVWIAGGVWAAEGLKWFTLLVGGTFTKNYLPLHLCSINLFLVAWHAWRPNRVLNNFLYLICIPGAVLALLFPSWTKLPLLNLMHIHSFVFHILLAVYPAMLLAGGDIRPQLRYVPKCMALLAGFAVAAAITNALLDTNYMYLSYAPSGTPLVWFADKWGNHLWGYVALFPLLILAMYLPVEYRASRRRRRFIV